MRLIHPALDYTQTVRPTKPLGCAKESLVKGSGWFSTGHRKRFIPQRSG